MVMIVDSTGGHTAQCALVHILDYDGSNCATLWVPEKAS
jgi:hypothetical protein